jgi:hypothetical protein
MYHTLNQSIGKETRSVLCSSPIDHTHYQLHLRPYGVVLTRVSDDLPRFASLDFVHPATDLNPIMNDGAIAFQPSNIVFDCLFQIRKWLEIECRLEHSSTRVLSYNFKSINVYSVGQIAISFCW